MLRRGGRWCGLKIFSFIPSDIENAVELGCKLLKFFPAEPSGGIPYLNSMSGPYAHLGLEYIPLGGLDENNFTHYLDLKHVPAVGGSWIAPRDLIQKKAWNIITTNARRAISFQHPLPRQGRP